MEGKTKEEKEGRKDGHLKKKLKQSEESDEEKENKNKMKTV